MTDASHAIGGMANGRGAVSGHQNAGTGIQRPLIDLLREIFPQKTWGKVSELLGLRERAAKHRIAGTRPRWWRDIKRQIELSELRKRQEEQRALIGRLEREAAE